MHHESTGESACADADLVLRTRSGDRAAFGELWRRHYPSGMAVARSITSSIDPDDLVQEAYTRIYQAILRGGGPNGSFRAYLFTSIRNSAAGWGRSRRETALDDLDAVADPASTDAAMDEALDRGLTAQAFRSLPSRWQEVLWYSEIEQMKPAAIAPLLGMKPGAVSQLAFRAREGLREAWIQAHLRSAAPDSPCHWTIEHLGAYSRGNLGTRDVKRLEEHLDDCARCMIVAAEAKDVSSRLALVLLPLVLGVTGASGYLSALQGGRVPVVALAAMPSSVLEGAVAVTGVAGAAGTAAPGAAAPAGITGGPVNSSGSSQGTHVGGIGALVGAGTAALVVAGVVAAAAVVPGMVDAAPATSPPVASESGSSAITTEVAPDASMSLDEPMSIDVSDDPVPVVPDSEPERPQPRPPDQIVDVTPAPEPSPVDDAPSETAPALAPVEPTEPVDPAPDPDPVTDPDEEPAGEGPAAENPDAEAPEGEDPGTSDPGGEEPAGEEPAGEPSPAPPPGVPTVSSAVVVFDVPNRVVYYAIPVSGAAGASVEAAYSATGAVADEAVLSEDGLGELELRPTWQQMCQDAEVTIAYVAGDVVGEEMTTSLHDLTDDRPPAGLCRLTGDETSVVAPEPDASQSTVPAEESTANTVQPAQAPAEIVPTPAAPAEAVAVEEAPVDVAPVGAAPVVVVPGGAAPAQSERNQPTADAESTVGPTQTESQK